MGFEMNVSVPVVTVFIQGLLSFFSPCVLPLLPLYIGYLSGGVLKRNEEGEAIYDRKKVLVNTVCFVIGISFAFFVLGFGVSALGQFFRGNQLLFARIGGMIVILLGLYQLGVFGVSERMAKERKIPFHFEKFAMSPGVALVMGFTFSFAWTPCVGPVLASVLLMTASAATTSAGFLLIGVYTLGFVVPYLAVGFFTTQILALFQKYRSVVKYTVKIGGLLLIVMGLMIFTGKMNAITGYLSSVTEQAVVEEKQDAGQNQEKETEIPVQKTETPIPVEETETMDQTEETEKNPAFPAAIDFTLRDQFGVEHTLSDYKGKVVFLNFWATWCPPCRAEMPDIQKLYEEYGQNQGEEVIILGVAAPNISGEGSEEEIAAFLSDHGYTYPVLMDTTGEIMNRYGIMSYPTTFMIDKDGNVPGYVSGSLSEDYMKDIIGQTIEGNKK